jgi:hypothetical protein
LACKARFIQAYVHNASNVVSDNLRVSLLADFPYFGFSVLLLGVAGLCLSWWQLRTLPPLRANARRLLLTAGLGCAPFGLFSFMYIPKYWSPRLTTWFGPASPEDILFAIGTAAIAMCLALWPLAGRWELPATDWRMFFTRYLGFSALGIGFGYGLIYSLLFVAGYQIDTMLACLISIAVSAALVFSRRPDLLRLSLGGALFAPFYWLALRLSFIIWPEFIHSWDAPEQSFGWIGGVPLYEVAWALGLGCVWPPFIAWCCGMQLRPSAAQSALTGEARGG